MTLAEFAMQHPHLWNLKYTRQDETTPTTTLVGIGGGYNLNADKMMEAMRQFNIAYIDPNYEHIVDDYVASLPEGEAEASVEFADALSKEQFIRQIIDEMVLEPALVSNQSKINEEFVAIKIPLGSEIWKLCNKIVWLDEPNIQLTPSFNVPDVKALVDKNANQIKPAADINLNITGMAELQIAQLVSDNIK